MEESSGPALINHWQFPNPETAGEVDVLGLGADLEPATLLQAYRSGIFPMPIAPGGPMASPLVRLALVAKDAEADRRRARASSAAAEPHHQFQDRPPRRPPLGDRTRPAPRHN